MFFLLSVCADELLSTPKTTTFFYPNQNAKSTIKPLDQVSNS